MIGPAQGVLKVMNHLKSFTNHKHLKKMPPTIEKKLLHDTHTKKRVSPPIMKTKG